MEYIAEAYTKSGCLRELQLSSHVEVKGSSGYFPRTPITKCIYIVIKFSQ